MKVTHDPETDAAYIYLTDVELEPGRSTTDVNDAIALDWKDGRLVGIEVLNASTLLPADLLAHAVTCPLEPHDRGLVYDKANDVMVCPRCGHRQYEEMGS